MLVDGLDCMVGDIPIASLFAISSRTPSFASSVVIDVDLPLSWHLVLLCLV